jgi:Glycosyl transferase family group 2
MGLLRRKALEQLAGWDEWTITEDADTSLRMLKAGWSGWYVAQPYGQGIMPLTFASLKGQRFRWCFGGMQILRRHWRELLPWRRSPDNQLTTAQRLDYLLGGLQWLNDLVYLGFTVVLLATAGLLLATGHAGLRPLLGVAVLLPVALVTSGFVRALWSLRVRTGIGLRRGLLAFANWLSLSWVVALACVAGLVRSKGVFLRTPKQGERHRLAGALWATRSETLLWLGLWGAAAVVATRAHPGPLLLTLLVWQGAIYGCAPFMAWLNLHTELSAQLERRRRTEGMRERAAQLAPYGTAAAAGFAAAALLVALVVAGGSHPAPARRSPFAVQHQGSAGGPLGNLIRGRPVTPSTAPGPSTSTPASGSTGSTSTSSSTPTTSAPSSAPPTTAPSGAASPTS